MAESLDGSKKVIAEKKKQKEVVVKKLRLLGRYVEKTCKNDMAIFMSSGFEPASGGKAQPQGLGPDVDDGNSDRRENAGHGYWSEAGHHLCIPGPLAGQVRLERLE